MQDRSPDKIYFPGHKKHIKEDDKSLVLLRVEGQQFYISVNEAIEIINNLSGALVVRGRVSRQ